MKRTKEASRFNKPLPFAFTRYDYPGGDPEYDQRIEFHLVRLDGEQAGRTLCGIEDRDPHLPEPCAQWIRQFGSVSCAMCKQIADDEESPHVIQIDRVQCGPMVVPDQYRHLFGAHVLVEQGKRVRDNALEEFATGRIFEAYMETMAELTIKAIRIKLQERMEADALRKHDEESAA